jgi:D-alanine-D-alanine ligase
MTAMRSKPRVLVLWNQVGEDEYVALAEQGPVALAWNPEQTATEVGTVQDEIDSIVDACKKCGYVTHAVNIADDFDTLSAAVRKAKPDVILNLVEFFNDEAAQEAYVAGLFDLWKIPYTGSPPLTLLTCQRKFRTKVLLEAQAVPTPAYAIFYEPVQSPVSLPYPLMVKPAREDASGGIDIDSVVHDHAALVDRVNFVLEEHQQPALVERYIGGREIHVAILGNSPPEVLPMLEFEFEAQEEDDNRPQILTYEAKWDPTSPDFYASDVQVPPRKLPRRLGNRLAEAALAAYRITGCRDYARIDFRVDNDGEPYILEVNPNPDLAEGVGFALCAEKSGRPFHKLIGELLGMALARGRKGRRSAKARKSNALRGKPSKGKARKAKTSKGGGRASKASGANSGARRGTASGADRAAAKGKASRPGKAAMRSGAVGRGKRRSKVVTPSAGDARGRSQRKGKPASA